MYVVNTPFGVINRGDQISDCPRAPKVTITAANKTRVRVLVTLLSPRDKTGSRS